MASPSSRAARIGMLTPSSNTVLEPTVQAMLAQSTATCTAHFSRFTVTEIGLNERQLSQFDPAPIVAAAELLGHAHCGAISWAGTSGSWLGLEQDTALCAAVTARCGCPCTTSTLALVAALRRDGVRRFALVTPYTQDVVDKIALTYAAAGFEIIGGVHLGLTDNASFADCEEAAVAEHCRVAAAESGVDAVVILCTNMRGAQSARALQEVDGITVYDSIAVTVAETLRLVDLAPAEIVPPAFLARL